jgi:signal transduction histidine kinase/CheY-like chemotaxis protein
MKHKDGHWVWIHNHGKCTVRSGTGNPIMMFGTISDITEHTRLEAEKTKLEEQNRQLKKAESLGLMSGSIAHIFNNQLQVVQGYLEMVIRDLPPGDSHAVALAKSLQASQKASEVSGNLLVYLGQKQVKPESFDLAELCRISLPLLQMERPENVVVEADLPSPGPCINADAKQIQKILTNLVINAWEAVGEGTGTVRLSVKIVSNADIPTAYRFPIEWRPQEQAYVCLEVTDSGCGIKKEDMDKIFDPFFSTKFTGRGLGLSIVLGIVGTHDAGITVKSKISGGSVFSVFFPLSVQMPKLKDEQPVQSLKIVKGGTVLLVEDETALREMIKFALMGFGFTVLQASDGVEAVEIFKKHKDEISCVLSDLTMPRMGGWETISALRAIRHDLPVILASGYDESTVMAGKHSDLPDFFMNKPYDINKLSDTIARAMARKKES